MVGYPTLDTFGKVNPVYQGPMFAPVELVPPDLSLLLQEVPEVIGSRIQQVVQKNHLGNLVRV